MVQWSHLVLLLAILLVTLGSAVKRDGYEIDIKHVPFEIHTTHFKESRGDGQKTEGQNNPQVGFKKEASLSEEAYDSKKEGRKHDGSNGTKSSRTRQGFKIGTKNQGTGGIRGEKKGKQSEGSIAWTYTTAFGPSDSTTNSAPTSTATFLKLGHRHAPGVKKQSLSSRRPQQSVIWGSTTPGYSNFVTTQQPIEHNLHKQGFIPGLEKLPLQKSVFQNNQSPSYGNIRTQGSSQGKEESDFKRTTKAPIVERKPADQKLIIVNPVTPSILFRNPQLRIPFSSDKTGPVQFTPLVYDVTTTTVRPIMNTSSKPTTTTTRTIQNPATKEEGDGDSIYLLVKYDKPRDGRKSKANVVEIIGGHSRVTQYSGNRRDRIGFERADIGSTSGEQMQANLMSVNMGGAHVTTTSGYSVSETLAKDELIQMTTPLALPINTTEGVLNGVNSGRNGTQPILTGLAPSFTFQLDQRSQRYMEQFKKASPPQQEMTMSMASSQQLDQGITANIPNQMNEKKSKSIQSKLPAPTTYWGIFAKQTEKEHSPIGSTGHNQFNTPNQGSQSKVNLQAGSRFELDRSAMVSTEEATGNSLQQLSEYDGLGLRDSYGHFVSDEYQNIDESTGLRRPDLQSTENINLSSEKFNGTTDPLEITRILVSRNGGLTVEQFNELFKDYFNKELTEDDLDSYERLINIAGSNEASFGSVAMTEKSDIQNQNDASNGISSSSEGTDKRLKVQINNAPVRQEPIVKIGYGSSKSHQGVYKSPKFFEQVKEISSQEERQGELHKKSLQGAYVDNPVFGFEASKRDDRQQQESKPERESLQQGNSVIDDSSKSGHQGGRSYIKFQKFN